MPGIADQESSMTIIHIVILAVIQGLAELLPVSSSAHVIVAAKLLGLDPTSPDMTLLLILLHTGTMFAVIGYFWSSWKRTFFASPVVFRQQVGRLAWATMWTAAVGIPLILGIEAGATHFGIIPKNAQGHAQKAEVEMLFGNLTLVSIALGLVGVLILVSGRAVWSAEKQRDVGLREAGWIGAVQGLCLPFRGFSRSGATISTALIMSVVKSRAEEFSFAMAVVITPPAIAREVLRVMKAHHDSTNSETTLGPILIPGLLGMVCAFLAGLVALKWLSGWLEQGRWYLFGIYCLVASIGVYLLHALGGY